MKPAPRVRGQRGITLIEVTLVTVVLGVLIAAAVPRFAPAVEQTRVDQASGILHSIWLAERMHWLEHHEFSASLEDLAAAHFVDAVLPALTEPFAYEILEADESRFTAHATREGSQDWLGELRIDELGELAGFTQDTGGLHVYPADS